MFGASEHSRRRVFFFNPSFNVTCPNLLQPSDWSSTVKKENENVIQLKIVCNNEL
jgi:hypothetical protein